MKRRLLPLLALGVVLGWPVEATNTDDDGELRVTLFDGTVFQGKVKPKKGTLEVTSGKKGKPKYKDISTIEDAPPPTAEEKAKDKAQFTKRGAALKEDDAPGWFRLGKWARDQELPEEAKQALEKAIAIDPAHAASRALLGQSKDGEAWVETAKLLQPERAKLEPSDLDGRVALARKALKGGADELAFSLLQEVLMRDTWHKDGIEAMRPLLARYRHTTAIKLPVRGRWKGSEDSSRHHQLKGYALFALDMNKIDGEGKVWSGDGKKLEDHHSFGQPFYAVAAGKVVSAHDGKTDNPPFTIPQEVIKADKDEMTHNGVAVLHENNEVSWYIHAKNGSIKVKVGDVVEQGQLLGEVGNSGRSAIPHMHFTLVNFGGLSIPWSCDDYTLIAEDGTPIRVARACPREGWIVESRDEPKK